MGSRKQYISLRHAVTIPFIDTTLYFPTSILSPSPTENMVKLAVSWRAYVVYTVVS